MPPPTGSAEDRSSVTVSNLLTLTHGRRSIDVIVQIDDTKVADSTELIVKIRAKQPGDTLNLTITVVEEDKETGGELFMIQSTRGKRNAMSMGIVVN